MPCVFLRLGSPGKDQVIGNSADKEHRGWMELANFGVSGWPTNPNPMSWLPAGALKSGKIVCTKAAEESFSLFRAAANGNSFESAILDVMYPRAGKWRLEMNEVVVSGYTAEPGRGSGPMQTFLLDFKRAKVNGVSLVNAA